MLNLLLKSSFYYMIWNKIKIHLGMIIISIISIILIIAIYNDIFTMFEINSKKDMVYLLLSKWGIIFFIIAFNYYKIFHKKKINDSKIKDEPEFTKENLSELSDFQIDNIDILKKEKLQSKTDLILKKYNK